jgi:catechol 2,3-dioxygenase-like lactoylglutathione lyase family enzyme
MSANKAKIGDATGGVVTAAAKVDLKLEVVVIPVSDVDRSKEFYKKLGWRLDAARIDTGVTSFRSVSDLTSALRRAAAAHGVHEKRIGGADANWPDWYAKYMAAEQAGTELPS